MSLFSAAKAQQQKAADIAPAGLDQATYERQCADLMEKAPSLIPAVLEQQQARLDAYADLDKKRDAAWEFFCERWGDWLQIKIRWMPRWYTGYMLRTQPDGTLECPPIDVAMSVNIGKESRIQLVGGRAADLFGASLFRISSRSTSAGTYETILAIEGADIDKITPSFPGTMYINLAASWQDGFARQPIKQIGPVVSGIARGSVDDQILFGDGDGLDAEGQSVNGVRPRDSVTIRCPPGRGESVYKHILTAIMLGAPGAAKAPQ